MAPLKKLRKAATLPENRAHSGKAFLPAGVAKAVLRRKPHPAASEFYAYRLWKNAPFFRLSGAFSLPKTLAPPPPHLQAGTPPARPKHPRAPHHPVHAALRSTGQNAPCKDFEMECGFAAKSSRGSPRTEPFSISFNPPNNCRNRLNFGKRHKYGIPRKGKKFGQCRFTNGRPPRHGRISPKKSESAPAGLKKSGCGLKKRPPANSARRPEK